MPRSKYIKPPGPLPDKAKIKRRTFQFKNNQRRELTSLLPARLTELGIPRDAAERQWGDLSATALPERVKTIADFLIEVTEHHINSHLTVAPLIKENRMNAANVRAAIRRLRTALKPFVNGWVDPETADIVPANLDARLAGREQEIAKLRLPSQKQRTLAMLCQQIEIFARQWAGANGETLNEQAMLRYVDSALNFAGFKHPDISRHRDRLAALVFPRHIPPHKQG